MAEFRSPRDQFIYEIAYWLPRLGSEPVRTVASENCSEDYQMNKAHVFELANGQYALVSEQGCSCYESEDASIDLYPDQSHALAAFMRWVKENKRDA